MTKQPVSKWRRLVNAVFHMLFVMFIVTGGLVIFHNVYFTPVKIVGRSMEPTLHDTEFGVMDTNSWRLDRVERFDIVIIQPDLNVDKFIIKRVIGLPGERLVLDDNGELYIDGTHLDQPFIDIDPYRLATCGTSAGIGCYTPIDLTSTQYFVMGDNRGNSQDSRASGPFEFTHIVGVLFSIEGVCQAGSASGESGVNLQSCAVRTYRWPTYY